MTDKYEAEMFDDGTEPTVRRLPKGTDQQGRYPEAAEAATDVGQEDEETEDTMWFWVVVVTIFTAVVAAAAWKGMV
jgi:hypothetical protein